MKVLYIFAGKRKDRFVGTPGKDFPDTQLYGLNHLYQFGIKAHYKEFFDVIPSRFLENYLSFNIRHAFMYFGIRGYDIVFGSALLPMMIFKKLFGGKGSFVILNISLTRTLKKNKKHTIKGRFIRSLLREVDAIVCFARSQRDYLINIELYPHEKVFIVAQGVDTSFFMPPPRMRGGNILSVGRDNARDYETMIKVARLLPEYQFQFICSKRNIKGITEIPFNVTVHFDINAKELREAYRKASLLLLATHDEHFLDGADCSGMTVLLEAFASGLPVIVTRRLCLEDYAEHGRTAIITDPYDADALAHNVRLIMKDTAQAQELGRNARKSVERDFSTAQMAERLKNIFQIIAKKTPICLFCEAHRVRIFLHYREHNATYYQCTSCGVVWLDTQHRVANPADYYSSVYYREDFHGRENINKAFSYRFRFIDHYLGNRGRLLEVGAASGDFLHLLKDRGFEVYGVELSERAATVAKERFGLDIFCGMLQDASFQSNFFDSIVMYHVLEHVSDPYELLIEARRILKPGGTLIIEVPHPTGFDARFSKRLLLNILDFPNHLFLFPPHLLKRMVAQSGYKVVAFEQSFSFLIAGIIQSLKSLLHKKTLRSHHESGASRMPLPTMRERGLTLRGASLFFPGMKLTVVVKKNDS